MPARRSAAGSRSCGARSKAGVSAPLWIEVPKSKRAPRAVKRALEDGADLILAWGGTGWCGAASTRSRTRRVPRDRSAGTRTCSPRTSASSATSQSRAGRAARRPSPAGRRLLQRRALRRDGRGRLRRGDDQECRRPERPSRPRAYVLGGLQLNAASFKAKINVDGTRWYKGAASCILVGNVGNLFGGIEVFADAQPTMACSTSAYSPEGPAVVPRSRTPSAAQKRVAVRTCHPGTQGAREARPQDSLRARWRRPQEGQVVQGRRRSRRDHRLRAARGTGEWSG